MLSVEKIYSNFIFFLSSFYERESIFQTLKTKGSDILSEFNYEFLQLPRHQF